MITKTEEANFRAEALNLAVLGDPNGSAESVLARANKYAHFMLTGHFPTADKGSTVVKLGKRSSK